MESRRDPGPFGGQVLEAFPLPTALLEGSGEILVWNSAFAALFNGLAGFPPDQLPVPLFDFLEELEAFKLSSFFARFARRGEGPQAVESPIRRASGQSAWLRFRLSRPEIPEAEGRILCVVEDLSGQKTREQGLVSAKQDAERAMSARSQFMANMSHEIRTPIQTIIGMIELLGETKLDHEQREYLRQARFSADVLLSLVADVLDITRIEAGRLEIERIDFDVRRCVEQAADMIALEAHAKGLELVVDVAEDLPAYVRGDPTRLRQIIVNLIKNAVKFTQRGEVFVTARKARAPDGGEALRLEVADTGIGVPPEIRPHLFKSFHQGDSSHTRKYGGSGLGLAISRHLAELMGGSLSYRPGEPEGSVFTLELPLERALYNPPEEPESLSGSILVVDDRLTARLVETRLAASLGLRAEGASSGTDALERLRRRAAEGRPFDLCAIDQNMPSMDGWRLASAIAADESINSARLVLMSPEGTMGPDAKMKLLNWFNGYVNKPVKRADFRNALARCLSSSLDLEEAEPEPAAAPTLMGGRAPVILVAEDHAVNQELFRIVLERAGCEVRLARDGAEAVELNRDWPFDMVFMDIQMPRLNGYQAAQAIRAAGGRMPIVAVTASADKGERERCLEAGMNDILVKPFHKGDIGMMLEFWLKHGFPAGPNREPEQAEPAYDDPEVFDYRAVMDTFLGRKDTVAALLPRFIESVRETIRRMDAAQESGDLASLAGEAHGLKGSALNLSASRLGRAAAALEEAARAGDAAAAEAAGELIKEAFFEFAQYAQYYVTSSY
jgi:signal transduction histidine kinase/CheY-like chemotaxis protein